MGAPLGGAAGKRGGGGGGEVPGLQQLIESAQEWERLASSVTTEGPGDVVTGGTGGASKSPRSSSSVSGDAAPVGPTGRKRRRHCSTACVQCAKSKSACDDQRPCARCIRQHGGVCEDRTWSQRATREEVAGADMENVFDAAVAAARVNPQDAGKGEGGAGAVQRKKRRQIAKGMACLACTRSKTGCDGGRPCGRCLRVNKGMCVDKPRSGSAAREAEIEEQPAPVPSSPPKPAPILELASSHRPHPGLPQPERRVESSASQSSFMSRVPSNAWSLPSRASSTETVYTDWVRASSLAGSNFGRAESLFGRVDSVFGRADSTNFGRAESNNFGRADSTNFGRAESNNFGRAESNNFGRAESSFGPAESFGRTETGFGNAVDATEEMMMGLSFGRLASTKPPQYPTPPSSFGSLNTASPLLPKNTASPAPLGCFDNFVRAPSEFERPALDVFQDPSDRNNIAKQPQQGAPPLNGQPLPFGGLHLPPPQLPTNALPPMMTPQLNNLEALAGAIAGMVQQQGGGQAAAGFPYAIGKMPGA